MIWSNPPTTIHSMTANWQSPTSYHLDRVYRRRGLAHSHQSSPLALPPEPLRSFAGALQPAQAEYQSENTNQPSQEWDIELSARTHDPPDADRFSVVRTARLGVLLQRRLPASPAPAGRMR